MAGVQECLSVLAFPDDRAASLSDAAYDEMIKGHRARVQQLLDAHGAAIMAHAMELTGSLDPYQHTLSYLSILDATIPTDSALYPTIDQVLIQRIAAFLVQFDARQVRYVGSGFTRLLGVVGSSVVMPAATAVKLITHALQTLDPAGHMLTSSHLDLARLAYHSDTAALALPVLGKTIVFFPAAAAATLLSSEPSASASENPRPPLLLCSADLAPPAYISKDTGLTLALSSGQILEYDYLVGLVHLSLRDYRAAVAAFARVVSHPTRDNGVSQIMVAAHRLWVLASLVAYGKAEGMPPHTSATVTRVCGVINKMHLRMAEAFAKTSPADLLAEAASAAAATAAGDGANRDRDLGQRNDWSLIKAVVAAHKKWQVVRLRDTYVTVSIAAVMAALAPAEAAPVIGAAPVTGAGAGTGAPTAAAAAATATATQRLTELAEASQPPATEADTVALLQGMIDEGMITAEIVLPSATPPPTTTTTTATATATTTPPAYLHFLPEHKWTTEKEFAAALHAAGRGMAEVRQLNKMTSELLALNRDYIKHYLRDQRSAANPGGLDDNKSGGLRGGGGFGDGMDIPYDEDLMWDLPGDYGGKV